MQEIKKVSTKLPQEWLDLVNQIFEIEKKNSLIEEENSIGRNITRLKGLIEEGIFKGGGMEYHNPIGESYSDTRTDCEATISGTSVENLEIIEVIKPIIKTVVTDAFHFCFNLTANIIFLLYLQGSTTLQ